VLGALHDLDRERGERGEPAEDPNGEEWSEQPARRPAFERDVEHDTEYERASEVDAERRPRELLDPHRERSGEPVTPERADSSADADRGHDTGASTTGSAPANEMIEGHRPMEVTSLLRGLISMG
jgi:hypothetical protein